MAWYFLTMLMLSGCAADLHNTQGWNTRREDHSHRLNRSAIINYETGRRLATSGYNLYIATSSVGLSFDTQDSFIETFHQHPRTAKDDHSLGHSWLLLESPTEIREAGHTGEYGVDEETYYEDFMKRLRRHDPNPVAAVWETKKDGRFHDGSDQYSPTFVVRIPITSRQYHDIYGYMNKYQYSEFSLLDRQCTDFVVGAAKLSGLDLTSHIVLELPMNVDFYGEEIPLWVDPKYRLLRIASPDILEEDLVKLVGEGYAENVTKWYEEEKDLDDESRPSNAMPI